MGTPLRQPCPPCAALVPPRNARFGSTESASPAGDESTPSRLDRFLRTWPPTAASAVRWQGIRREANLRGFFPNRAAQNAAEM